MDEQTNDQVITMTRTDLDEAIQRACDAYRAQRWRTVCLILVLLFCGTMISSLIARDQARSATRELEREIALLRKIVTLAHNPDPDLVNVAIEADDSPFSADEWQAIDELEVFEPAPEISGRATAPLTRFDTNATINSDPREPATEPWEALIVDTPAAPITPPGSGPPTLSSSTPERWKPSLSADAPKPLRAADPPSSTWQRTSPRHPDAHRHSAPASVQMPRVALAPQENDRESANAETVHRKTASRVSAPAVITRRPRPLARDNTRNRYLPAVSFSRRRDPGEELTVIGPDRSSQIADGPRRALQ